MVSFYMESHWFVDALKDIHNIAMQDTQCSLDDALVIFVDGLLYEEGSFHSIQWTANEIDEYYHQGRLYGNMSDTEPVYEFLKELCEVLESKSIRSCTVSKINILSRCGKRLCVNVVDVTYL